MLPCWMWCCNRAGNAWLSGFGWDGHSHQGCWKPQEGRTLGQHPAPGLLRHFRPGRWPGKQSRALLEDTRKKSQLCSILTCIPPLSSHFPYSGQKHGDPRFIFQVLRVKKAQVIITQMPGCGTAHQGQGLCRRSMVITGFCGHSLPPEIQGLTCFSLRLTKKLPCYIFIQEQQR